MNQIVLTYTLFSLLPLAVKVALRIELHADSDIAWLSVACTHSWWNVKVLSGFLNHFGRTLSPRFDTGLNMGLQGVIRFNPIIGQESDCLGVFSPSEVADHAVMADLLERVVDVGGLWSTTVKSLLETPDPLTVPMAEATPVQRRARMAHLRAS